MIQRWKSGGLLLLLVTMAVLISAMTTFAGTTSYTYDELNRLKTETYPDGTVIRYDYDKLGNRTAKTVTLPFVTIQASSGENGSISPSGDVSVRKRDSQQFTMQANTGYHISDVQIDDSSLTNLPYGNDLASYTYTFSNVTAPHKIYVQFSINIYTLTASSSANGTISPSGQVMVQYGQSQSFTMQANTCYHISDVKIDGTSLNLAYGNDLVSYTYTFSNVSAAHTIDVQFSINTYSLTSYAGDNGSLSPSGQVIVTCGSSQTFTITPVAGAHIADTIIDGQSTGLTASTYQFTNVTANHKIAGVFACASATPPIRIERTPNTLYYTLQAAYNDAIAGDNIQARTVYMFGDLSMGTVDKNLSVSGGFSCEFAAQTGIATPVKGSVNLQHGSATMKNLNLQAQLPDDAYQLNVSVDGDTTGSSVTSSLNDMSSTSDLTKVYYSGTTVTLTPQPGACYDFIGWEGACTGMGTCTVTMNAAKNVTAKYKIKTFTVSTYADENGSISPSVTVNCGTSPSFAITPDEGAYIVDVIVDGTSVGAVNSRTFSNINANHTVVAVFACSNPLLPVRVKHQETYTYYSSLQDAYDHATIDDTIQSRAVYLSGGLNLNTSGKNLSVEGGYNCRFTAQTGRTTPIIKGAVNVSGGTVNMKNLELQAQLPENEYELDITLSGDAAGGTVTSSLNDVLSPSDYTKAYYSGTTVTLTATPINDCYDFNGWTGCTNANGNQCTVTVDQAKNVSANFTIKKYQIDVSINHSGVILPASGLVNCGSTPTYTITPDSGATVDHVVLDAGTANETNLGPVTSYTFTNGVYAPHSLSVVILCPSPLVLLDGVGYRDTIQAAYNDAPEGATIKTQDYNLTESVTFSGSKTVTLEGGYYCDFGSNAGRTTHIKGSINISGGKVTMKNIVLDK